MLTKELDALRRRACLSPFDRMSMVQLEVRKSGALFETQITRQVIRQKKSRLGGNECLTGLLGLSSTGSEPGMFPGTDVTRFHPLL